MNNVFNITCTLDNKLTIEDMWIYEKSIVLSNNKFEIGNRREVERLMKTLMSVEHIDIIERNYYKGIGDNFILFYENRDCGRCVLTHAQNLCSSYYRCFDKYMLEQQLNNYPFSIKRVGFHLGSDVEKNIFLHQKQ